MKMNPVFGKGTGVRLDQAGALFLRDEQHPEMPRLTRQGIQLSAEMVSSTYSLSLEDWQQAGWQDVHVEIDRLMTSAMQGEDGAPEMMENLKMKLARKGQKKMKRPQKRQKKMKRPQKRQKKMKLPQKR